MAAAPPAAGLVTNPTERTSWTPPGPRGKFAHMDGVLSMRMSKVDWLLVPLLAACILAVLAFAFRAFGFLGVGFLGLWIALIAGILDTGDDLPTFRRKGRKVQDRSLLSELFGVDISERREPEPDALVWIVHIARVIGAGMIILGFGLFYQFQLGR
jgi:hypothetical protein